MVEKRILVLSLVLIVIFGFMFVVLHAGVVLACNQGDAQDCSENGKPGTQTCNVQDEISGNWDWGSCNTNTNPTDGTDGGTSQVCTPSDITPERYYVACTFMKEVADPESPEGYKKISVSGQEEWQHTPQRICVYSTGEEEITPEETIKLSECQEISSNSCGNRVCDNGETHLSCPGDCPEENPCELSASPPDAIEKFSDYIYKITSGKLGNPIPSLGPCPCSGSSSGGCATHSVGDFCTINGQAGNCQALGSEASSPNPKCSCQLTGGDKGCDSTKDKPKCSGSDLLVCSNNGQWVIQEHPPCMACMKDGTPGGAKFSSWFENEECETETVKQGKCNMGRCLPYCNYRTTGHDYVISPIVKDRPLSAPEICARDLYSPYDPFSPRHNPGETLECRLLEEDYGSYNGYTSWEGTGENIEKGSYGCAKCITGEYNPSGEFEKGHSSDHASELGGRFWYITTSGEYKDAGEACYVYGKNGKCDGNGFCVLGESEDIKEKTKDNVKEKGVPKEKLDLVNVVGGSLNKVNPTGGTGSAFVGPSNSFYMFFQNDCPSFDGIVYQFEPDGLIYNIPIERTLVFPETNCPVKDEEDVLVGFPNSFLTDPELFSKCDQEVQATDKQTVSASGGEYTFDNGDVIMNVPEGAVSSDTEITVKRIKLSNCIRMIADEDNNNKVSTPEAMNIVYQPWDFGTQNLLDVTKSWINNA